MKKRLNFNFSCFHDMDAVLFNAPMTGSMTILKSVLVLNYFAKLTSVGFM